MIFISTEVTHKAVQVCRWECLVGALVQAEYSVVCRWEYLVGALVQADSRLRLRTLMALRGMPMCNLDSEDSYSDSEYLQ